MWNRFVFVVKRLQERLWLRPLLLAVLSVAAAFVARVANNLPIGGRVPEIASDSIETLLAITAGSMLVIATLAVASMVSAYASASSTATPRAFSLLISDDLSQNALSTFLGAFIFTFVALVALKNGFYDSSGLFVLFSMTVAVLAIVIVTFVRWVDWIARLGRIGTTVEKVEAAGAEAFRRIRGNPRLGGAAIPTGLDCGHPVHGDAVGYVQHVNVGSLQEFASRHGIRVRLNARPGFFAAPGRPLVFLHWDGDADAAVDVAVLRRAFNIGDGRVYDDDPRFALVALSEIACRALSPAVNDPGTAIAIFGSFIRLFGIVAEPPDDDAAAEPQFDRVLVPDLKPDDMLDDAFRAVSRDGAGLVEVQVRLQKTLKSIAAMPDERLAEAAKKQSRAALARAEAALDHLPDIELVRDTANWSR